MCLGTEVGLGPGHIVLVGDPVPSKRGAVAPTFLPMSIVAKRLDGSRRHSVLTTEIGLGSGHIALDGDHLPPPWKGAQQPLLFAPSVVAKQPLISQLLSSTQSGCSTFQDSRPLYRRAAVVTGLTQAYPS